MPRFVHHLFGPEGAAYVRRYLERNRDHPAAPADCHIGGRLLAHHDIDRGVVWSEIPDTAPPELVERFEQGGVLWRTGFLKADGLRPWLARRLSAADAVVVADDLVGRRTDGFFEQRPDLPVVFCEDVPYRYAMSGEVEQALDMTSGDIRWRPEISILTTARGLTPGRIVSSAWVDGAAAAATAIMVGAWDDEGVLCWEPG